MPSLNEIRELCRHEKFDAALLQIKEIEDAGMVSPQVLTLKAICIQLNSQVQEYDLHAVENALISALQIDGEFFEALIELGWFYLNVQDKAEHALPLFQRAFEISKAHISEAAIGIAKCLSEVSSPQEAIIYLKNIHSQTIDSVTLKAIQEEISNFSDKTTK